MPNKSGSNIKIDEISTGKIEISIPQKDEKLAELRGIILGDGCIQNKNGQYTIRIVGDSIKDREYLLGYVKPLLDSLFSVRSTVYYHNKFKELYIVLSSKKAVHFLLSMGLKAGDKVKNGISFPLWILGKHWRSLEFRAQKFIDTKMEKRHLKSTSLRSQN